MLLRHLRENVIVAIEIIILIARVAMQHQHHRQFRFAIPLQRRVHVVRHHLARIFEPVVPFVIAFGAVKRILAGFQRLEQTIRGVYARSEIVRQLRLVGQTEIRAVPVAAAHVDGFRQHVGIADRRLHAVVP